MEHLQEQSEVETQFLIYLIGQDTESLEILREGNRMTSILKNFKESYKSVQQMIATHI